MPGSVTAKTRNLAGGHVVGLICGALGALTASYLPWPIVAYALAVGLSIFVMVVTDTEHPPASGTALGVAMTGCPWEGVVGVLTGVVVLAVAHRLLRTRLRDLT
jgi:CBS-domain-containing membrane protein